MLPAEPRREGGVGWDGERNEGEGWEEEGSRGGSAREGRFLRCTVDHRKGVHSNIIIVRQFVRRVYLSELIRIFNRILPS